MGQANKEKTISIILRDKVRDIHKEVKKWEYKYHKNKGALRVNMPTESGFRRTMESVRQVTRRQKEESDLKQDKKFEHLRAKYREVRRGDLHPSLARYKDLQVYRVEEDGDRVEEEEVESVREVLESLELSGSKGVSRQPVESVEQSVSQNGELSGLKQMSSKSNSKIKIVKKIKKKKGKKIK